MRYLKAAGLALVVTIMVVAIALGALALALAVVVLIAMVLKGSACIQTIAVLGLIALMVWVPSFIGFCREAAS